MTAAKRRKQALRRSAKKLQEQVDYLARKCDGLVFELKDAAYAFQEARMGREVAEARHRDLLETVTNLKMMEPLPPIVLDASLAEYLKSEMAKSGQPAKQKGEE